MAARPAALALALCLAVSSCSSGKHPARSDADGQGGPAGSSAPSTPAVTGSSTSRTSGAPGATSSAKPGSSPTTTKPGATSAPGQAAAPQPCFRPVNTANNDIPFTMTVQPLNPGIGDTITVTIKTKPNALVGVTFEFIDHKNHGGYSSSLGQGTPDGSWVYAWPVAPDVPPGPARVSGVAGINGSRGAASEVHFRVKGDWKGTCIP